MGIAYPLRTQLPDYIENIMYPSPCWGGGGVVEILNWGSQPGGCYGVVDILWRGAVRIFPAFSRSQKNVRSTVRHVHDNLLQKHRLGASSVSRISIIFSLTSWSIVQIPPGMIFWMKWSLKFFYWNFRW